jgi:lipoprotein LprG
VRRSLATALAGLVVLAGLGPLAGCSGGSSGGSAGNPGQLLERAKGTLDQTSGVHFRLVTDQLPSGTGGLLDADGVGTHQPAFRGTISASENGFTVDADVVAVHSKVYVKVSISPIYQTINPADYGAPDPATLMDPRHGISALLTAATDLRQRGQTRDGSEVITSVSGSLPGGRIAALFPSADASRPFAAVFDVAGSSQLRQATITGPFYAGNPPVTYTVTLDGYGQKAQISAP